MSGLNWIPEPPLPPGLFDPVMALLKNRPCLVYWPQIEADAQARERCVRDVGEYLLRLNYSIPPNPDIIDYLIPVDPTSRHYRNAANSPYGLRHVHRIERTILNCVWPAFTWVRMCLSQPTDSN